MQSYIAREKASIAKFVIEGGAGVLLDMPLDAEKTLESLTLETVANDVVIGLMGITLQQ